MSVSSLKEREIFPDFKSTACLYQSERSKVFRGRRQSSGDPLVIKQLHEAATTPENIARLRLEHTISRKLSLEGVAGVRSCEIHGGRHFLVMDDVGSDSLDQHLRRSTWRAPSDAEGLLRFLRAAESLADTLARVHAASIIHKDIKPHNIIFNPETGDTKLIDFGIASLIAVESPEIVSSSGFEGSLAYISPEQTGRMNRGLDSRSDLYSVGVTFFELLTGERLFASEDPLELIHCHLAKVPARVRDRNPHVPAILSDIVAKLLAKAPEDRYQGALGLKRDLEECRRQLEATGSVGPFAIGAHDNSLVFQIATKLYGREEPTRRLLERFDEIASGRTPSVLAVVSGYSGIGKSAIINEIHWPLTQRRGYFISGKFDQFKRGIPYASLVQAFRDLLRQILTEPDAAIASWKQKILSAVPLNGSILVDVLPELQAIIGPQPPVEPLGAIENQNRFNKTFIDFTAAFCSEAHPLALFLDDLQWADLPTLGLLEMLVTDASISHLLLVVAYRDNEVDDQHPLTATLGRVAMSRPCEYVRLAPLELHHVHELLSDSLLCPPERVRGLADHVFAKTHGNPFFVKMFLQSVYRDGLLWFDVDAGQWAFDLERIAAMATTDNVVDLVIERLRRFSPETQNALAFAAYVGNEFPLRLPAFAAGIGFQDFAKLLWPALREGLIVPIGGDYRTMEFADAPDARFRFLHDRAQQAAFALIPEGSRAATHLQIGRVLLERLGAAELREFEFDIANHLNEAHHLVTDSEERIRIAKLDLAVAQRAKGASAYEPAKAYAEAGLAFLPGGALETHYELAFGLTLEKGELEYLTGRWDAALVTLTDILGSARTRLDRARIYVLMNSAYTIQNQPRKSLEIVIRALAEFGVHLDTDMSFAEVGGEIQRAYGSFIVGKDIESYFDLPPMDDPEQVAILDLLANCMVPTFFLGLPLFVVLPIRMAEISIRHGNSPLASLGYLSLAAITLGAGAKDFATARRFGRLGLRIHDEKYPVKAIEANLHFFWGGMVAPYTEEITKAYESLERGYHSGVEHGSYQWAGYCTQNTLHIDFYALTHLAAVEEKIAKVSPTLAKLDQNALRYYQIVRTSIRTLTEGSADPLAFFDELLPDNRAVIAKCRAEGELTLAFLDATCRLALAVWYGLTEAALEAGAIAESCVGGAAGIYANPVFHFYYGIALARGCDDATPEKRAEYLQKIEQLSALFAQWAKTAPTTYEHQRHILEAESARLRGRIEDAAASFERGIAGARESGFLVNEALANELAGQMFLRLGRKSPAKGYLSEATDLYARWGARAKVAQMRSAYGESIPSDPSYGSRTGTARTTSGSLDLITVLKASQTLSEEVVLAKLLDTLIRIVVENAGARTGALLMKGEGGFSVRVVGSLHEGEISVTGPETKDVPLARSVVQYVARTGESVILRDASSEGMFASDADIVARGVRSVLCVPIVRQGRTTAVVYLENGLVAGTFTEARAEMLKMLAGQIAISIENALLYEEMEERVRQRTRELQGRNEAMRLVLDNVDQGLATIGRDGSIVGERSAAFVRSFGDADGPLGTILAGHDDSLATSLTFGCEQVFGDLLPIELGIAQMPSSLVYGASTFALAYKPIVEHGDARGLLLVTTDITEEVKAREAEAIQREQVKTFEHRMRDPSGFAEFFTEASGLVGRINSDDFASSEERLRVIHTLKGNVSLFDLLSIASDAHRLEQAHIDGDLPAVEEAKRTLLGRWNAFEARMRSLGGAGGDTIELPKKDYQRLVDQIREHVPHAELEALVVEFQYETVRVRLERLANQIVALSRRSGKGEPEVTIHDGGLRLAPESAPRFWSALAHVVRNLVDHGFETLEEREENGKPAANRAELSARRDGDWIVFELADDGHGIQWARLREKAAAAGLPSATRDDLTAALFADGISAACEVTDLSGRGVGMAEVLAACRALGGRIAIESEPSKGTRFRFELPAAAVRASGE